MNQNNDMDDWPGSSTSQPGLEELIRMSASYNGFKRENAVRRLGMLGNPVAIPCLIVRANDWVFQVRAAAHAALTKLIDAGHADAFVASLPAIFHLQRCRRDDHSALLQAITRLLLRTENLPALVAAVGNPDARVARLASRLLVEQRAIGLAEIVAKCLSHADVLVRSTAIDLLRELNDVDFRAVVDTALRDSYMPVRREAFRLLLERDAEAGLKAAKDLLFDASSSIREIAVQHLLAAGEPVEQLYADAFTQDQHRMAAVTCALWCWGTMNVRSRIPQVLDLLDAEFPSIRRAALQSIARLLQDEAGSHLQRALADSSPAVSKEAARLIGKLGLRPGVETLMQIALSSEASHVALACCRVIRRGNKWDWLRFTLAVYGAIRSPVSAEVFSGELNSWQAHFNGSSAQPDQATLREIVTLLRPSRTKLTDLQIQLLEFTLRSYGATP